MGRRAWAFLERRLRAARHFRQHLEGFHDRLLAHIAAPDRAEATLLVSDPPIARRDGKMHQSDGLSRCRAAWTRDAGDRHGEINVRMFEGTERHCGRGFLAHRAEGVDDVVIDAEHRVLGGVGVGDEAAFKPLAGASHLGAGGGNQPAGAAFGGGEHPLLVL